MTSDCFSYSLLYTCILFVSVTTGATALASTIDTEAEAQRYILPEALQRQRDLQLLHHGQQDFGGRLFSAEDLDGLPSTILTPQLSATNPTWTKNQELTDGTPCFMVNSIELALVDDVADLDVENLTKKSSDVGHFYGVLNPLLDASKPTYALYQPNPKYTTIPLWHTQLILDNKYSNN